MKKVISILLSFVILFSSAAEMTTFAASYTEPTFSVSDVSGKAGETVKVNVSISNNPGIVAFRLRLAYDSDSLELVSTEEGVFPLTLGPTSKNPFTITWSDGIHGNYTTNGLIVALTFNIKSDAPVGETPITLSYEEDDVCDINFENVHFDIDNATATVEVTPVPVTGVNLDRNTMSLKTGESDKLTAVIEPSTATNTQMDWESSNTKVTTVDNEGNVNAVNPGTATITVTTNDGGYKASCVVTVDCAHNSTTIVPAKPSTCVEHGHDEYEVCDDCKAVISGSDAELPLTEHVYTEKAAEKYLKTPATCVNKAVYYESCSVCGEIGTETFEYGNVNPNNHVGDTYLVGQKAATCEAEGYTGDVYCSDCDEMITAGITTPMVSHTPSDEWKQTKAPTCTETGTKVQKCTVCGKEYLEVIPALGHKMVKIAAKKATCTSDGNYQYYKCSTCGKVFKDASGKTATTVAAQTIKKTGHKMVKVAAKKATCTSNGNYQYYKCSTCGKLFKDAAGKTATTAAAQTIKKTGHKMVKVAYKKATCKATGNYQYYKCSTCGKVFKDAAGKTATTVAAQTIKKTAHTYKTYKSVTKATQKKDGKIVTTVKCSVCGAVKSTSTKKIPRVSKVTLQKTTFGYNWYYTGKEITPYITVKDSTGKKLKRGIDYSLTYDQNRKNIGRYAIKVTFKGNYSGTKTFTFDIVPRKTTITSVIGKSRGFTVWWKKNMVQTKGYQIQFSTAKNMKNAITVAVIKNNNYGRSITGRMTKRTYYVRMRVYSKVKYNGKWIYVYSPWTTCKSVRTK